MKLAPDPVCTKIRRDGCKTAAANECKEVGGVSSWAESCPKRHSPPPRAEPRRADHLWHHVEECVCLSGTRAVRKGSSHALGNTEAVTAALFPRQPSDTSNFQAGRLLPGRI